MILLFGDLRDPHVAFVKAAIARQGRVAAVFSRYNRNCRISVHTGKKLPSVEIHADGQHFNGYEVTAVWWRQKPFSVFYPEQPHRDEEQQFVGREWQQLLNSLPEFLPNARWINHPHSQVIANGKALQMVWASQAGFLVPKTIFGNDFDDVLRAVRTEPTVYKTLSGFVSTSGEAVMTTPITPEHLCGARDRVGIAPGIYQNYVDKEFELRITFVGDKILAVKIDSQSDPSTQIDWRADQSRSEIYSAFDLSPSWQHIVRRYAELSSLSFGAIDAIVTPNAELFFLECNPAGQWLWMEEACGVGIVDAVATALIQ